MRLFVILTLMVASLLTAQAQISNALSLDGDGDYVNIADDFWLRLGEGDYTVEAVFNLDSFNSWYQSTILSKRNGLPEEGYIFSISGEAHPVERRYRAYGQTGGGLDPYIFGETILDLNSWYQVTFVYHQEPDMIRIFLNGELNGESFGFPNPVYTTDEELNIGRDPYGGEYYFKGLLDEVRIWGVARSQEEIQQYMNSELPSSVYTNPSSGLIAYYKFNETENLGIGNDGLSDDIRDYGPNGFHGDLVGDAHLEYDFLGWQTPITVSENNTETSQTLYFGLESSATQGLDGHLGEVVLPPVPPSGAFDSRFLLPDNNASLRDYRNSENVTSVWEMYFQPGQQGYPMTISWSPSSLPEGEFILTDISGELIEVDMKTVDNLIIENTSIDKLHITYNYITSKTFEVNAGWNIVSAPLMTADMSPGTLFEGAISDLFTFDNGYLPVNSVENGKGYWVKYQSSEVIGHYGSVPSGDIEITEGWNLVGPFSEALSVGNLITVPAGIISSSFYGFGEMYYTTTDLEPGKGYWIKSEGDGIINIGSRKSSTPGMMIKEEIPEESGVITIRSGEVEQRLYLSTKNTDITKYELPPSPPQGVKDIRYDGDTYLEVIDGYDKGIEIRSIEGEVEIAVAGMDIELETGGKRETIRDGQSLTITARGTEERLLVNSAGVVNTYYLANSYPNPFNPTTRIKFNIAESEQVALRVYDVLGNEVSTLVDGLLPAGEHSVEFNGTTLASGVYIYKLTTQNFSATKKMVLMK